ncbi:hypothetical protein CK203_109326 [Vitis vinifera]|uniref:Uncharacterized protein n=1 Tax=Vitis vinifera TaxID=29760 RepID=A0A438C4R9_VITVI|nr:hypothetical protein CK203_109326 [Vitis vinifera]
MEREVAVKKLEKSRVHMESALRSAVQTIISGKKKICEGKSVSTVLEEEIEDLAEKLEKLQRSSDAKDFEVKKFGDSEKENGGIVKGVLLERMKEEYGSMLSTANCSIASSASTSRRIEAPDSSSSQYRNHIRIEELLLQETVSHEEHGCSGRCKVIVRRIMEQVRTETEQWSQMQEMLEQVEEWKQKALSSNDKANELQAQENHQANSNSTMQKEQVLSEGRKNIHTQCCSSASKTVTVSEIGNLAPMLRQNSKAIFLCIALSFQDKVNLQRNRQSEILTLNSVGRVHPKIWVSNHGNKNGGACRVVDRDMHFVGGDHFNIEHGNQVHHWLCCWSFALAYAFDSAISDRLLEALGHKQAVMQNMKQPFNPSDSNA